ncbi:MAG: hypothetical protein ABFC62_11815 [Clostridiaceae bacterium]
MEASCQKKRVFEPELVFTLLFMLFGYILLHDLLGGTLFAHSDWDSYTLQAMAWREGKADLGQNYAWLELAVYNGKYFVSFPPLPSVAVLPLTFLFGAFTPNNALMVAYAMLTVALAYRVLRFKGTSPASAGFLSLFYVWGSNMLWMSTNGGVWFQAQALNLLLLTWMVLSALKGRRVLAYALAALAVGCRPFSAVEFLPLFVYFYTLDDQKGKGFFKTALMQLKCVPLPVLIAAAYMWYNFIRFQSPFEFGHNYLPEFIESPEGQFSLTYVPGNLYNLFLRPLAFDLSLRLKLEYFNGFMFYVANPLFLLWFIRVVRDAFKKRVSVFKLSLLAAAALNILLLCAHKTLGGWQFGARYTVDMLPYALWYMIDGGAWEPKRHEKFIAILGIAFNVYGALAMTFLYQ